MELVLVVEGRAGAGGGGVAWFLGQGGEVRARGGRSVAQSRPNAPRSASPRFPRQNLRPTASSARSAFALISLAHTAGCMLTMT